MNSTHFYLIVQKQEYFALLIMTTLRELIAALSICKMVICCDGGAMHIAATLRY